MNLTELCNKENENIIELRRTFHKYPEPYWREFWTTGKIVEFLNKLPLKLYFGKDIIDEKMVVNYPKPEEIEKAKKFAEENGADLSYLEKSQGFTGVIAELDTGKPGKTTVLRFDIDSNEINESEDENHIPYKFGFSSLHKGCAHCCGHDGHISIGLTTAKVLCEFKESLNGKIIFIFQPGEETVVGGRCFINNRFFENPDYFLSAHIGIKAKENDTEMIGVKGFLSTKKIDAEFLGKASHAGVSPEQGHNALLAASLAITSMYTVCQDGRGSRRVNVGFIEGGSTRNAVCDRVYIKMEVRGETDEICEDMYSQCLNIMKNAAAMYGVRADIRLVGEAHCGHSDKELTDICEEVIKKLYPDHKILRNQDFGASEDVTFMLNKVRENGGKSHFMMLGTRLAAAHHNSAFDFDEDVLLKGVRIFTAIVEKLNG